MKHKTKQWKYTNQKWNTKHTAILKKEIVVLKDLNQCDCFFVQYDTIHILFILSFLGENKNFSFNPVFRDKNIDFFCQSYFSGRKWEMQIMQRYIQWEKTAICFLHFCVSFGFLFLIIFVCLNCKMATDADNCLVSEFTYGGGGEGGWLGMKMNEGIGSRSLQHKKSSLTDRVDLRNK